MFKSFLNHFESFLITFKSSLNHTRGIVWRFGPVDLDQSLAYRGVRMDGGPPLHNGTWEGGGLNKCYAAEEEKRIARNGTAYTIATLALRWVTYSCQPQHTRRMGATETARHSGWYCPQANVNVQGGRPPCSHIYG